jgi:hypothetical protein
MHELGIESSFNLIEYKMQLESFDRMMLSDFEALGFELMPFDIKKYKRNGINPVRAALNSFRLNNIVSGDFTNLDNKIWMFIRPIGTIFSPTTTNDNNMFSHIVMIQ